MNNTRNQASGKYYVSKFCIQVFSDAPIPADIPLMDIIHEALCGSYAADIWCQDMNREQIGSQVDLAMTLSGSDPGFFDLDQNGNKIKR